MQRSAHAHTPFQKRVFSFPCSFSPSPSPADGRCTRASTSGRCLSLFNREVQFNLGFNHNVVGRTFLLCFLVNSPTFLTTEGPLLTWPLLIAAAPTAAAALPPPLPPPPLPALFLPLLDGGVLEDFFLLLLWARARALTAAGDREACDFCDVADAVATAAAGAGVESPAGSAPAAAAAPLPPPWSVLLLVVVVVVLSAPAMAGRPGLIPRLDRETFGFGTTSDVLLKADGPATLLRPRPSPPTAAAAPPGAPAGLISIIACCKRRVQRGVQYV